MTTEKHPMTIQGYNDLKEELDHLKMLVEAWVAHIGEAEVKPYFLPLDEHLTQNP